MRRSSPATKTDRHRDEAVADSHFRDEGFQAHLHDPATVPVPGPVVLSVPERASTEQDPSQNNEPEFHRHTIAASNTSIADAFPADGATATPTATATATVTTTASGTATPNTLASTTPHLHQNNADSEDYSDSDIDNFDSDIDLDLSFDISPDIALSSLLRPPSFNHLNQHNFPLNLNHNYPSHLEDYDFDMSDSDGGAPLDDIIAAAHIDSTVPQLVFQGHPPPSDEDDDDQVPDPGSLNYLHPFAFHIPAMEGAGLIMDVPPPLGWAPPPTNAPQNQQPAPQLAPPANDVWDDGPLVSNPNPTMLGSENLGLIDFVRNWAIQARMASSQSTARSNAPCPHSIREQATRQIDEVRYSDLQGDACDMQGIDWAAMGTTRSHARKRRYLTYRNYTNKEGSDRWTPLVRDVKIPPHDSFFRFRNLHVRPDVYLAHFQLRSVLACPSRSQAFYPGTRGINCINPISRKTELALDLSGISGLGSIISTLDAKHGVLMAGMFNGEYCLRNLESDDRRHFVDGQITGNPGGITNHLQIHLPRRSSRPVAALASNDHGFRVMDLSTETFLMDTVYPFPLNCTAISPDGRLRVMVGDHCNVIISNAETGQIQKELTGHRDFGFSCDWSDDGWTVATGFQDKGVKIWDARRWCSTSGEGRPLCTIRSEMAGVRNLRFSPGGSGQRVLVAAEEADYINIIDAQTFRTKQTVDIFGEIGGVAFTNDGQNLSVLCSDHHRGGLLQLERCGRGIEPFIDDEWPQQAKYFSSHNRKGNQIRPYEPYRRRPTMLDSVIFL
ncbi:hypothetical protein BGZ61DRAFT_524990 [Ilyonectria robusta]|uniref:uncharacterized protein n=1 Tax=Ilyonectria robusta TaxID=1079257 RepID=UPI001E8DA709|nr:uncharacterized protein BGZ61DRAFT_524990 [Ilyonectria robusta]KAH8736750.1 hypothetical protein BGZ61DRAFT_524990 [Ilyonectria robusta]